MSVAIRCRDGRYSIGLMWCGHPERRYAVHFCNEWLGQSLTREGALEIYKNHKHKCQEEIASLAAI